MDRGRSAGGVRRAGIGRTGFDVSRVRWIVSIPERDLWAAKVGAADFVSVHLATFLQRSAVDFERMHRASGLRRLLLAQPRNNLRRTHCRVAYSRRGAAAGELD